MDDHNRRRLIVCMLMHFMTALQTLWSYQLMHLLHTIRARRAALQRYIQDQQEIQIRQFMGMSSSRLTFLFPYRNTRRTWMKARTGTWWIRIYEGHFEEHDWIEAFRMSKASFNKLCDLAELFMKPSQESIRVPIDTRKRVAIAVYKLGNCCENSVVANLFGVHRSTVVKFLHMFCKGVIEHLLSKFIYLPDEDEAKAIASRVKDKAKIPQVMGFIDCTHIPMIPPSESSKDFINSKMWASYVLQGVVDDQFRFRDITCNAPGSAHNGEVFQKSSFIQNSHLLPKVTTELKVTTTNNTNLTTSIPMLILGNPAYPLLPWLITGFPEHGRTPEEESFNMYLSDAQVSVEQTFARLKARWRMLLQRMDVHHSFAPHVIATCCVLHNFLESEKEAFEPIWLETAEEYNRQYPQPSCYPNSDLDNQAINTRKVIMLYLAQNYDLQQSLLTDR